MAHLWKVFQTRLDVSEGRQETILACLQSHPESKRFTVCFQILAMKYPDRDSRNTFQIRFYGRHQLMDQKCWAWPRAGKYRYWT